MSCPAVDDFLAFLEGRLSASDSLRLQAHVDTCSECGQLLAALGRGAERQKPPLSVREPAEVDPIVTEPMRASLPESGAGFLSPGDRVDQYSVLRMIGRGGMGEVYLARDTDLGRRAALKVLRAESFALPDAAERVLREARTTARFAHPNIVAIYGVGRIQGAPYLALEYVPGETLRQRLLRGGLSSAERNSIATGIAHALREAHHHNVMHGDLKPSNVLLGEDGRVRVLDFGLARVLRENTGAMLDITEVAPDRSDSSAAIQGTPAYMAPEQWAGLRCTLASDAWAFGVLWFEVTCGKLPFTMAEVARGDAEIRTTLAQVARDGMLLLDEEVALLEVCLQCDPSKRANADRLVELVDAVSTSSPTRAKGADGGAIQPARSQMPDGRTAPPPAPTTPSLRAASAMMIAAVLVVAAAFAAAQRPAREPSLSTPARTVQPARSPDESTSSGPVQPSVVALPVSPANEPPLPDTVPSTLPQGDRRRAEGSAATDNMPLPATSPTRGTPMGASSPPSAPPGGGVGYVSLNALGSLEDRAEEADRAARAEPDAVKAQRSRERAATFRRLADDQLSGVEREVARTPDMPAADAARLREYVRQGRAYLSKRRSSAGGSSP